MADTVLLTGISGYLGGHIALQLLKAGYLVRGSVRDLARAGTVQDALRDAGADVSQLSFVALDLLQDDGWTDAMRGVRYLMHTASPFVLRPPRDGSALIQPAVQGTERALTTALCANVERVVLTSSIAAIAYGHGTTTHFSETDWSRLDGGGVPAYQQSKTLAERRAREIMERACRHDDLVAINPGVIMGPLLDNDPGTSAAILIPLLGGKVPAVPRICLNLVDVRDVAAAHVAALDAPHAGGRRHIMVSQTMSLRDVSETLQHALPERRLPRWTIPDGLVRLYAIANADVRNGLAELGQDKFLDGSSGGRLLQRDYRPTRDSIVDTARSLIARSLV